MKVKIISSRPGYWYEEHVGHVFEVKHRGIKGCEYEHSFGFIDAKDCEIVEDDAKQTNPKDLAATTRLDLSLFPDSAVIYGALGMTEGDLKYGGYNFRVDGVKLSVYMAALRRHSKKFYNGEWADKKTKVPHLASMLGSVAIIIDGFVKGNIIDDRPPAVDITKLLDEMQDNVEHLQKIFKRKTPRYTEKKQ